MQGIDEATLAVLLDEAPRLHELRFHSSPLPYDVLVWASQRCGELRTVHMIGSIAKPVQYASSLAPERFVPLQGPPSLPSLTTCVFRCDALPDDTRAASFALLSYLVHHAPALAYLSLPHSEWLKGHPQLLCTLARLPALRGLSLGSASWMLEGELARYWLPAGTQRSRVQRELWRKGTVTQVHATNPYAMLYHPTTR